MAGTAFLLLGCTSLYKSNHIQSYGVDAVLNPAIKDLPACKYACRTSTRFTSLCGTLYKQPLRDTNRPCKTSTSPHKPLWDATCASRTCTSLCAKVATLVELVPGLTILGETLPALLGHPPILRSYCRTLCVWGVSTGNTK